MGSPGKRIHIEFVSWVIMTRETVLIMISTLKVITFEKGSGWIQWTWKTEQADDWSYSAGLQYGWIPHYPTDLKYPHICG